MTNTTPRQTGAGSHSVTLTRDGRQVDKEEVYPTFDATWRGAAVTVQMRADRYRHSSGLSEWRIYVTEAHDADRSALTPTARTRLTAQLRPMVEEWLASPAYAVSRRQAFVNMLQREYFDLRPAREDATRGVRRILEVHCAEFAPEIHERFTRAADQFDAYADTLLGGDRY